MFTISFGNTIVSSFSDLVRTCPKYILIENAIKYSGTGSTVTVSFKPPKEGKSHLFISVEDSGEGIGPAQIPRLTERFYRVDKGRSRAQGGTGLGLAIVKHILIRHRGWLKISSQLGKGSIFANAEGNRAGSRIDRNCHGDRFPERVREHVCQPVVHHSRD